MDRKIIARALYDIFQEEKSSMSFLNMADWVNERFIEKDVNEDVMWIDQWLNLFPEGVKNAGKPIRGDRELCTKKMKVFLKKYSYTPQEILEATQDYLDERSLKNYEYTMLSNNFISHQIKGSLLAQLCEENRKEKKQTYQKVNNDFI